MLKEIISPAGGKIDVESMFERARSAEASGFDSPKVMAFFAASVRPCTKAGRARNAAAARALALPASITWDRSDDLLNPSRGFRLTTRLSPEFTLRNQSNFNYLKAQFEATAYKPFGDSLVLAGRFHLGSIVGANRGVIAPDRRFYAGGGGSVRGYVFQGVGPRNEDNVPTGGNSLTELAVEARYRFQALGQDLGIGIGGFQFQNIRRRKALMNLAAPGPSDDLDIGLAGHVAGQERHIDGQEFHQVDGGDLPRIERRAAGSIIKSAIFFAASGTMGP